MRERELHVAAHSRPRHFVLSNHFYVINLFLQIGCRQNQLQKVDINKNWCDTYLNVYIPYRLTGRFIYDVNSNFASD